MVATPLRPTPARRRLREALARMVEAEAGFSEADHPRWPAGDPRGGKFAPKRGGLAASKHAGAALPPGAVGFVDPPKGPAGIGFHDGRQQMSADDPAGLVGAGRGRGPGVVAMVQHRPYWLGVKYPTQEAALAAADAALKRNGYDDDEVCYVVKDGVIEFAVRGSADFIGISRLSESMKERMRGADFTHSHPGGTAVASNSTLSAADFSAAYSGGFRIRAISPTTDSVWEFTPRTFGRPVQDAEGELRVGTMIAQDKRAIESRMVEAVTRVLGKEVWQISEFSGPVGRAILGSSQVAMEKYIADQRFGRLRHVSRDPQNEASLSKLLRPADFNEIRKQVANPQVWPSQEPRSLPPPSLDITEGVSAVPLPDIDDRHEFAMATRGPRPRGGRRAVRKVLEATAFQSADHPRWPKGDPRGGKFAPKGRAGLRAVLRALQPGATQASFLGAMGEVLPLDPPQAPAAAPPPASKRSRKPAPAPAGEVLPGVGRLPLGATGVEPPQTMWGRPLPRAPELDGERMLAGSYRKMTRGEVYHVGVTFDTPEAALAAARAGLRHHKGDEVAYVVEGRTITVAMRGDPSRVHVTDGIRGGMLPPGSTLVHNHPNGNAALSPADLDVACRFGFAIEAVAPHHTERPMQEWRFTPTHGHAPGSNQARWAGEHVAAIDVTMTRALERFLLDQERLQVAVGTRGVGLRDDVFARLVQSVALDMAQHPDVRAVGRLEPIPGQPERESRGVRGLLTEEEWQGVLRAHSRGRLYSNSGETLPPLQESALLAPGEEVVLDDRFIHPDHPPYPDLPARRHSKAGRRRLREALARMLEGQGAFSEADHPRHPAGSPQGGKFAPKGRAGLRAALVRLAEPGATQGSFLGALGEVLPVGGGAAGAGTAGGGTLSLTAAQARAVGRVDDDAALTRADAPVITLTAAQVKALGADQRGGEGVWRDLNLRTGSMAAALALTDAALRAMPLSLHTPESRANPPPRATGLGGRERVYLMTTDGTILGYGEGVGNRVDFSTMRHRGRPVVLNHNHPGNQAGLSGPDVMALTSDAGELDVVAIRAVSATHHMTASRAPGAGRPSKRQTEDLLVVGNTDVRGAFMPVVERSRYDHQVTRAASLTDPAMTLLHLRRGVYGAGGPGAPRGAGLDFVGIRLATSYPDISLEQAAERVAAGLLLE